MPIFDELRTGFRGEATPAAAWYGWLPGRYRVALPGAGQLEVEADDPADAARRFDAACGVRESIHTHDVERLG